jgi:hypothetical protein
VESSPSHRLNFMAMRLIKVLTILAALLLLRMPALALEAVVQPSEVDPGDAFVVRVTGADSTPSASFDGSFRGSGLNFAACGKGCFVAIGVADVEAKPGDYDIRVEGSGENLTLKVKEAKFPVQRLTLPEDKVTLSPADEKRAEVEAVKLRAILSEVTEKRYEGSFIMPLENSFSTEFGVKRVMNGQKKGSHGGVDIRGGRGEPVKASNNGVVVLAEKLFFGGNTLVIDHGLGIYSIYMHLSAFNASRGQKVSKGEVVGFVGSTGRATGPHLHFGVKVDMTNANPVSLVNLPL